MAALSRTIPLTLVALALLVPIQRATGTPLPHSLGMADAAPRNAAPGADRAARSTDERCSTAWLEADGVSPVAFQPARRLGSVGGSTGTARLSSGPRLESGQQPRPSSPHADGPGQRLAFDDGVWQPVATSTRHVAVRPGQHFAVRVDTAGRGLLDLLPQDGLRDSARWAIDYAPDWLADELAAAFAELSADRQDLYANLLLASRDPIVDEVAFQIAHLGAGTLNHRLFTPDLIVRNAQLMYEHDRELQYVDIVNHGSAAEGGDYFSTTLYFYRRGPQGGIAWAEVPRDVYYWYVVHPRLSDETVKASTEASTRQATYGYFWREYLFRNPDPSHDYTAPRAGYAGFPLLADVLRRPTVLWDGETVNLDGERPWTDADTALDVLGHWVSSILPDKASGNRPVQPNQIAYEHNGNCGEIQDLLGAASRTGLVPNVLISDHCEDHVWNQVYVMEPEEGWIPYQVDWDGGPTRINVWGVAYDRDRGGGKDVSAVWAWRPDGLPIDVVDRYSQACSLLVRVRDAKGRPVDGAVVVVYSEAWQSTEFVPATFAATDSRGQAAFRLGDHQNYGLRIASELGNYPTDGQTMVQVIRDAVADETYLHEAVVSGEASVPAFAVAAPPSGDHFRLLARFSVPAEFASAASLFAPDGVFRTRYQPGQLGAFLLSEEAYTAYRNREPFVADGALADASEGLFDVGLTSATGVRYVVYDAGGRSRNTQLLDVSVTLYVPAPPATATPTATATSAPTATLVRPEFAIHLPVAVRDHAPW